MSDFEARRWAELARQERRRQGGVHPSRERLIAYEAGELDPAESNELQEHLAVCRSCAQTVLDVRRFREIVEAEDLDALKGPGEVPGKAETEASWQALRLRLASAPAGPAAPAASWGRFHRWTRSPVTVAALAAGLAACLIGFPLWIASQPATGRSALPVVFYPGIGGEVVRSVGAGQPVSIRLSEAPAVLALPLPGETAFPSYRIEILTPSGELRLTADVSPIPLASAAAGVARPEDASPTRYLAVELTRGQLAPGDYRVRIIGRNGSRGEVLAEHALRALPSRSQGL